MRRLSLRTLFFLATLLAIAVTWWKVGSDSHLRNAAWLAEGRADKAEEELEFLLLQQAVSRTLNYPTGTHPADLRKIDEKISRSTLLFQTIQKETPGVASRVKNWLRRTRLKDGTEVVVVESSSTLSRNGAGGTSYALLFGVPKGFDIRHDRLDLIAVREEDRGAFQIVDEDGDGVLDLVHHVPWGRWGSVGFEEAYEITSTGFVFKNRIPIPEAGSRGPIPPAKGVVVEIKGNLCVISIGADDGVAKGQVFNVIREGKTMGQMTIAETRPNTAMAKFNSSSELVIQEGDRIE